MFCNASPIWRFLAALAAEERTEQARIATNGLSFDGGLSGSGVAVVKHHIFRIAERAQLTRPGRLQALDGSSHANCIELLTERRTRAL